MTTDRELLELAAKAVGVNGQYFWNIDDAGIETEGGRVWNPLSDDGDALQLAVKLRMLVEVDHYDAMANGIAERLLPDMKPELVMAATRRAIVRAAAEIGRVMP